MRVPLSLLLLLGVLASPRVFADTLNVEFERYKKEKGVMYRDVDPDLDGTITEEEKRRFVQIRKLISTNADTTERVGAEQRRLYHLANASLEEVESDGGVDDFVDFIELAIKDKPQPQDIAGFRREYIALPEAKPWRPFNLRLRGTYGLTDLITELDYPSKGNSAFKAAAPATFSFAQDVTTNTPIWNASGTLALPLPLYAPDGEKPESEGGILGYGLKRIHLLPAFMFNRVTNSSKNLNLQGANSLSFYAGGVFGIGRTTKMPPMFPDYISLIPSVRYDSDFDFDFSQIAVALSVQPVVLEPVTINGSFLELFPFLFNTRHLLSSEFKESIPHIFDYRTDLALGISGGSVLDGGDNPNLVTGDGFCRLTLKSGLVVIFSSNMLRDSEIDDYLAKRLSFFANYSLTVGLAGEPLTAALFEGGMRFSFDDLGQFMLQASYRNGTDQVTYLDIEDFLISLGVKF